MHHETTFGFRTAETLTLRSVAVVLATALLWGCGGGREAEAQLPCRNCNVILITGNASAHTYMPPPVIPAELNTRVVVFMTK